MHPGRCSLLAQGECPRSLATESSGSGELELTDCSPAMDIGVGSSSAFANNAATQNLSAPLQVSLSLALQERSG